LARAVVEAFGAARHGVASCHDGIAWLVAATLLGSTSGGPMSLNLGVILRESAKNHPGESAIIIGETRLTYGQLHGYAQRLAGSLAKLGVRRGQHVALMLPNVPQFTIAYFAVHY